jgi:hypothetical protein
MIIAIPIHINFKFQFKPQISTLSGTRNYPIRTLFSAGSQQNLIQPHLMKQQREHSKWTSAVKSCHPFNPVGNAGFPHTLVHLRTHIQTHKYMHKTWLAEWRQWPCGLVLLQQCRLIAFVMLLIVGGHSAISPGMYNSTTISNKPCACKCEIASHAACKRNNRVEILARRAPIHLSCIAIIMPPLNRDNKCEKFG